MKPVLTPQEAVELDRQAQGRGIAAETLMERAGWSVARAVADLLGGTYGRRVVVVCGKGNNGGDGYVAARHLSRWGMRVTVVTLDSPEGMREPAATNHRRLAAAGVRVRRFTARTLDRELDRADAVIDAVFGTGFRGQPEDDWAEAIDAMDGCGVPVVSVDIPSGVNGATGEIGGTAVRAALTVTFGAAKTGVVLMPGTELAGDVRVVDIGYPGDLMPRGTGLTEPADVAAVLPAREADAHKKASGTLVVVAGSREMTGAARLMARGAGRIGAGYIIVAVPASALQIVQEGLTEAVFVPLAETPEGTLSPEAVPAVLEKLSGAHALAIGPGMSQHPQTQAAIRELVRTSPVPVVLDADGLNAFAGDAASLADRKAEAVLTPHLGELSRLTGPESGDRLDAARRLAALTGAVSLVKGTRTVIATPDGRARINPTGSPALATAGTGDVLTGAIGGLLARGIEPFGAAWAGAYLHGLAGILAGSDSGDGTLAGDVAENLPEAVSMVVGE
jgi:NAD(P)H-hydrate epimerase